MNNLLSSIILTLALVYNKNRYCILDILTKLFYVLTLYDGEVEENIAKARKLVVKNKKHW